VPEEIMANSAAGGASDYNTEIIKEFRANKGRVGGMWEGTTLILIHHTGAKSGIERVKPVACSPQEGGRFAIWAANGGSPTHPEWYYNLKANPKDHSRGGHPDVHGSSGGTGRHRPRRAVAEAGRGVAEAGRGVP
jgi:deazaflavin-dependent oxidoreductase (nitroreductase family)